MKKMMGVLLLALAGLFLAQAGFGPEAQAEPTVPLTDQADRPIKPGPYKRIISLYGAHTENLFHLGLDEEIIGVSSDESFPPEARTKPVFTAKDSIEKYLAAKPDLVLIRPMHLGAYGRLVQGLESYGICVAALQVTESGELYDYWRLLGVLTGKELEAKKMISDFEIRINYLRQTVAETKERPNVFIEAFHNGTKTYMENTLPIWLLGLAGGRNIATNVTSPSDTMVAAFGQERLLAHQEDLDFYFIMNGPMNQTTADDLKKIPAYQHIKAVKNNNIFQIEEYLLARPTPRLLQGLEKIIGILHPEIKNMDKEHD